MKIELIKVHYSEVIYGLEDSTYTSFEEVIDDLKNFDNYDLMGMFGGYESSVMCSIKYENGDTTHAPLSMFIEVKLEFKIK